MLVFRKTGDHVRPEQQSRSSRAQSHPITRQQLFRRRIVSARAGADLSARASVHRPRTGRARGRRSPHVAPGGRWARARAHAQRRGADLQRVPASAGGDPARPRPHARAHRVPAAPLDLRPARQPDRRTALRARPVPEPAQLPAAALERPAVRGQRLRRRGRADRHGAARRARLQRLRARPRAAARVRLQLEDLHRGVSGGLPRRARSTPGSAASSPAKTCAGSSAATIRCRRWACATRSRSRARRCTSAGTTR